MIPSISMSQPDFNQRHASESQDPNKVATTWDNMMYEIHSIWLFTYSDIKTILGPNIVFGVFNGLHASAFGLPCPKYPMILKRIPLVVLWIWINLIPFLIDNQRQSTAIKEDSVNKPWRPMPSKRMSPSRAKAWMLGLYPVAVLSSFLVGGVRQCLCLICLGIWYNDLEGADRNPVIRNLINGCGFLCYASGAMEVAYGSWVPLSSHSPLFHWLAIIGAAVLTTVHIQDMHDQAGDILRSRRSIPLVIGDWPSRITIAVPMAFWSWFGPWFWGLSVSASVSLMSLGLTVILRTLFFRRVADDKRTFLLWNLWVVGFYLLPVLSKRY